MSNPDNFIIDLLNRGGKDTQNLTEQIRMLPMMRKQHTISCFLLGNEIYNSNLIIRKLIDKAISDIRPDNIHENCTKRFRYIWMMISLFHDLGYNIEDGNSSLTYPELRMAYTKLNVSKEALCKPYSKKMIGRYLDYRWERWQHIDHGIAGGVLLYKELCELRKQKESIGSQTLYWGKELEKDFLFASWIIACHNIYKITQNDESEIYYRHFKLEDLITPQKIIDIDKSPLLFLLCLVDNIEPVKQIREIDPTDKIELFFPQNKLIVNANNLTEDILRCQYLGKILALNAWLTEVIVEGTNKAIIAI